MKKEQLTLLIGVILCMFFTFVLLYLMGIDVYNVASVSIGVLLATVLIMKALTRQESEKTFLLNGVSVVSVVFVLILLVIAVSIPAAFLYIFLVYGIAIIVYRSLFFFAKRMARKG